MIPKLVEVDRRSQTLPKFGAGTSAKGIARVPLHHVRRRVGVRAYSLAPTTPHGSRDGRALSPRPSACVRLSQGPPPCLPIKGGR